MKKYQYQIKDRVLAFDNEDWIIPGTITAKDGSLYCVEYDCGGYDWLLWDEVRPLAYNIGDYVETRIGLGKIISIDQDYGLITVSYGLVDACYYEFELKPAPKPSFLTRLLAHFNKR